MATYIDLSEIKPVKIIDTVNNRADDENEDEKTKKKVSEKNDKKDIIKEILKKNIEDKKDIQKKVNILVRAMIQGKPEIVKRLIKDGAPIDVTYLNQNGEVLTPLVFAMETGRVDIFLLVLDRILGEGIDSKKLYLVKTTMLRTCIHNIFPFAKILLIITNKYIDFKDASIYKDCQKDLDGKLKYVYNATCASYIHFCGLFGSSDVLELLLEEDTGIDINQKDSNGNTALHLASHCGHSKCVTILIQHGANIDEINEDGCTALLVAIKSASVELIFILISAGGDVNAVDCRGISPILVAANRGRDELIHILIIYGANVNTKNLFCKTALMYACEAGDVSAVRELLYNGASVNAVDMNKVDAFTIALDKKHDLILSVIVRAHRGVGNFKNLGWHKVLDRKMYRSILTMLDSLLQPEIGRKGVKVDFTILEMDKNNVTPGDVEKYGNGGRRNIYLLQKFAECDNEEIAYHGVTRLLVNQKFKLFGSFLLWFKTIVFISFLLAMLYALVHVAQENRTAQNIYSSPITGWNYLRYICEMYVFLFWMSNIVAELAEIIQVIIYARRECLGERIEQENLEDRRNLEEKDYQQDRIPEGNNIIGNGDIGPKLLKIESIIGKKYSGDLNIPFEELQNSKEYSNRINSHLRDIKSFSSTNNLVKGNNDEISTGNKSEFRENYIREQEISDDGMAYKTGSDEFYFGNKSGNDYITNLKKQWKIGEKEEQSMELIEEEKKTRTEKLRNALRNNLFVHILHNYFHDWYNWLDIIGNLFLLIVIIYRIIIFVNPNVRYIEFHWIFATFAFGVNSIRLIKLLSVFKIFGTYMRIIILILCQDVPKFVLLLILTVIYFSTILFLSNRIPVIQGEVNNTITYYITLFDLPEIRDEGLHKYTHSLIFPIRVLLEGNTLQFNYLFNSFNVVTVVIYILFQFLIVIVYLNVFVAQLSDTYAEVKRNAEKTVSKYRLEFIVQMETTSLLALIIDLRKRFFKECYIMEEAEWTEYFKTCFSRLESGNFTTHVPMENLHVTLNELEQQHKISSRTQEILQTTVEKRVKEQQSDVADLKRAIACLQNQNKNILENLVQIAQSM